MSGCVPIRRERMSGWPQSGAGGAERLAGSDTSRCSATSLPTSHPDPVGQRLPAGVRAVIARRVARVSEESQRVLTLGAVVGRGFSLELLEAVGDVTGDALLTALEEAEDNALIVPTSAREATWEFSHGLIRQTLADGLSVPRRQRLHLRVAEALESGDAGTHVTDLAHHFYQAGGSADPATTLRYVMMAGDRGLETWAFEEALRHLEQASSLVPAEDQEAHALIRRKRGVAHRSVLRWEDAIEDWTQAVSLYEARPRGARC